MKNVILLLFCMGLISCSSNEEETKFQIKDVENAIEFIPMVSSIVDEIEDNPNFEGGVSEYGSFSSGEINRSFSPCDEGIKSLSTNAQFTLATVDRVIEHRFLQSTGFNDDDCSFDAFGIIVRSFELKEVMENKTRVFSSEDLFDYTGSLHGGGLRVLKDTTAYILEITGAYFQEQRNSIPTSSVSFYSIDPFRLNKIERSGRTMAAGTVVVRDNIQKKQMTLRTQSLEYSVTCCHPFKGFGSLEMGGEILNLKFEGCGMVKVEGSLFGKATVSLKACQ